MIKIRRALLSVSDKTGLVELAKTLRDCQIEILSTGGTSALLHQHGIPHLEVSDYTKFPEIMEGRVKTLHPKVHGGLLGRTELDDEVMHKHGIQPIDLLVVNLYPFANTINHDDCTLPLAIENIDVGGPAMIRAAAKNHQRVSVVVDPHDYAQVQEAIQKTGKVAPDQRFQMAIKAFSHTASYDGMIANALSSYHQHHDFHQLGEYHHQAWQLKQPLRYGENPHQTAAFYTRATVENGTISCAKQHSGKPLSYNNIADADAALSCVKQFDEPACVIVKHANPCGVAIAKDILTAYQRAYQTDTTSAFGGIIAFNRELDVSTACAILNQQFVEVIIAPNASQEAIQIVAEKPNVRLLTVGQWSEPSSTGWTYHATEGGLLVQSRDTLIFDPHNLQVVTERAPTEQEWQDLLFVWKVAQFVKSNAIVYGKQNATIGIGAGQMSRVYSAKIAAIKAHDQQLEVSGSVMASDAFFPFRDGIDQAAAAGITAVIQPGGSLRDVEVITAANEHGMAMIFTGIRHFLH